VSSVLPVDCISSLRLQLISVSERIDTQLKQERLERRRNPELKILIIGAAQSGKVGCRGSYSKYSATC
jgi:hypothetical protein